MFPPLFLYQLLVLAVLIALLGMVVVNMLVLPSMGKYRGEGQEPEVAVLIPARNEDSIIEACLRGLLAQDYSSYSVWVYDDASTDNTGQIAARLANEDKRLRVVTGTGDPPPGWLGKANACHRLYGEMRKSTTPDFVLFTDADVKHEPGAIRSAVATARGTGAGLLSVFPRQRMGSWAERLAVPIMQCWAVYGILPLPLAFVRWSGPAFAAANGQFMLFSTEAYEACGGHSAVRDNVLEDVGMARAVKRRRYTAMLADGGSMVVTRMYNGADEVWRGYSKNVYAFFGYSPLFLAIGVIVLVALYIVPPVMALLGVLSGRLGMEWLLLPAVQYAAAVATRLVLSARFAYPMLDSFLHPVAIGYLIAIAVNSRRWARTGKGAWKGRAHLAK